MTNQNDTISDDIWEADPNKPIPKITYDYYSRMRSDGVTVIDIRQYWNEIHLTSSIQQLVQTMIMTFIGVSLMGFISKLYNAPNIWITSPNKYTTIKLPLYQAMRIVRKYDWTYTEVAPIRKVSRWEALKILIKGDTKVNECPKCIEEKAK